jgi:hypothetical protein
MTKETFIIEANKKKQLIDDLCERFGGGQVSVVDNIEVAVQCLNGFETVSFHPLDNPIDNVAFEVEVSDCYYDRGQEIRDFINENIDKYIE